MICVLFEFTPTALCRLSATSLTMFHVYREGRHEHPVRCEPYILRFPSSNFGKLRRLICSTMEMRREAFRYCIHSAERICIILVSTRWRWRYAVQWSDEGKREKEKRKVLAKILRKQPSVTSRINRCPRQLGCIRTGLGSASRLIPPLPSSTSPSTTTAHCDIRTPHSLCFFCELQPL